MFTSRSAVELYKDCPRARWNQYFRDGKGLVKIQKSVPLVTGSAVHRGVEHLANRLRINEEPSVDTAVGLALQQYDEDVGKAGFSGRQMKTDKQQWFTYNEQKALTEGLVRAWAKVELPQIKDRFKVIGVERDIEPIEISPDVWFQAKVDMELQELATGDYYNYSLKTTKQWNEKNEESYKSDLQGCTEIWAMEEDAKRVNRFLDEAVKNVQGYADVLKIAPKQLVDIAAYLTKKKVDKKLSGIRFCYLVKGIWKETTWNEESLWLTYSPLIRGYKNFSPNEVNYAHSWFYPNSENKSGKSILGKGWEPFNVWEEMGVKEWMEMISTIQPDCGDIIKAQVVTPIEYSRDEEDIRVSMMEIERQEKRISLGLKHTDTGNDVVMADIFPHNKKHCYFHFGEICEYLELCWMPEIKDRPIESGLYQIREPHHNSERNS